jgi:predicted dehydrogenase
MTRSDRQRAVGSADQPEHARAIYRRVALVGCGRRFASSVAPTLWDAGTLVVLAADPDPRARERVASIAPHRDHLSLRNSLTQQELVASGADAVIVSSPSGLHFEHCAIALSCRLPTFVEKPLACTAPDAKTLQEASRRLLVASEQRIHREDLGYVRSVIRSGKLGEILEIRYDDSVIPTPHFARTWRNDPRLAGGGILLDLGYHTVGSVQWLLDVRSEAMAVTEAHLTTNSLRVEDAAQIVCMAGGTQISLDIRLVSLAPRERVLVRGTRGELRLERQRKRPSAADIALVVDGDKHRRVRMPLDESTDSKSLLDFLRGRSKASWLARHVDALEFLEAAYKSSG